MRIDFGHVARVNVWLLCTPLRLWREVECLLGRCGGSPVETSGRWLGACVIFWYRAGAVCYTGSGVALICYGMSRWLWCGAGMMSHGLWYYAGRGPGVWDYCPSMSGGEQCEPRGWWLFIYSTGYQDLFVGITVASSARYRYGGKGWCICLSVCWLLLLSVLFPYYLAVCYDLN